MTKRSDNIEILYDFIYIAQIEVDGRDFRLLFRKEARSDIVTLHIEVELTKEEFYNLRTIDGDKIENLNEDRYRFLCWLSDALLEMNPENHQESIEKLKPNYRHWMRNPDNTRTLLTLVLFLQLPFCENQLVKFLEDLCFFSAGRLDSVKMEVMDDKKPVCWTINEKVQKRKTENDELHLLTTQSSMSGH